MEEAIMKAEMWAELINVSITSTQSALNYGWVDILNVPLTDSLLNESLKKSSIK